MAHCSRRNFLKTGLAAGALAGTGSLPLRAARGDSYGLGNARKIRRQGDAARVRHRDIQRANAARTRTGRVHEAGAPRLRPRHPLLRDRRVLRRDAQDAGRGAEGHSARQLPADVEGDDARRRQSAGEDRRTAQAREHRLLRRHAAALPARRDVADRHRALAGRDSGSQVEEGRGGARRVGARAAGAAPGSRETNGSRSP